MSMLKWFAVLALCVLAFGARAEERAILIELPSGTLPSDISSNGMVVGELRSGGAFYWLPTTGVIYAGGQRAAAVSRAGDTFAGIARDTRNIEQAAIWQRAAEWQLLGSIAPNALPCDALLSGTWDVSNDGKVLVGLAWNGCNIARAFRWEESTGMVDLGSTVAGRSTRANGVSGDGRVVLGWQESSTGLRQGARWIDGRQELFTGSGVEGLVGEARTSNLDGSFIVGQVCEFASFANLYANQQAWTWTSREGVRCLQPPRVRTLNNYIGIAQAMSEDGRIIGGAQSFGLDAEAVLWIDREPMYLKDYLRANGVPDAFENWVNTGFITGISGDGKVLVGQGAGRRDFQGYIVVLGSGARP